MAKIIFTISICIFLFWAGGQIIDIYRYAFVGAVFEMLWLPMLATMFVLPVIAFIFWAKAKFELRSFFLYAMIISITTILLMIFKS